MAITYVNKNAAVGTAVSLTGVTAGNLICSMITWFDDSSGGDPTLSDGTNPPDAYSNVQTVGTTQQRMRFGYWVSSPKSGSVTYTWTLPGGTAGVACVFEMQHDAAVSIENINNGATNTTGATATSASASSAEASLVIFGGAGFYNTKTFSAATIDGVAVDQTADADDGVNQDHGTMTMRIVNNPGAYTSDITMTASGDPWVADAISFKEAAAGGGSVRLRRAGLLGVH